MEIHKAELDDAEELVRLSESVQKMHVEHHPQVFRSQLDAQKVETFFRELIVNKANSIFIATESDRAVGYVWCTVHEKRETPFKYGYDTIYIQHISVDPEYQRKGVGRNLMEAVDKLARIASINNFALDSWAFNHDAHAFFERLGFTLQSINMWRQTNGD